MTLDVLKRLEKLNQVKLTDAEEADFLAFYAAREAELSVLNAINTENTERMVHVMPLVNVVREDVAVKQFTRDQLQEHAPEVTDGYWQVPRLVE